ncbi:MAG: FIST N-terminal domain-containing protein [Pseudomonadota bacterium]
MDGSAPVTGRSASEGLAPVVRRGHAPCDDVAAATDRLAAAFGAGPFALVVVFAAPCTDFAALMSACRARFPEAQVIGCTTAGEISPEGYTSGEIVGIALPAESFATRIVAIQDVSRLDGNAVATRLMHERACLARRHPDWQHDCALMLVDGLSQSEEEVAATLSLALGPTPFFGGSAGDGLAFRQTKLGHNGAVMQNAAVVALIRTRCPIRVFRFDHLRPTATKMVVTAADPERRVVSELNAEPAAREYARMLGKENETLCRQTFAANPVLVRIGGQHHVRAIRQVAPNGELVFFSAIEEGLVLTLAEPEDMTAHLEGELCRLAEGGAPDLIIACDCILRRVEAEQTQAVRAISRMFAAHRVVGFNTYGEQHNGAHVNQTMTGLAIYPAEP